MFRFDTVEIFDGAVGTMLQKAGLEPGKSSDSMNVTNPEAVAEIHKAYVQAGSTVICANTFCINGYNGAQKGYDVTEMVTKAVEIAKTAGAKVAVDLGPIGQMMAPLGTMTFDQAYDYFKEIAVAGEAAGADCVAIETMYDLAEMRVALLAVKENTNLPILATMTFQENGKTYVGSDAKAFALVADGLGVSALGVNCSFGPDSVLPIIQEMATVTELPFVIKPNAGLPDSETGAYNMSSSQFTQAMGEFLPLGCGIIGGCCGTTPTFIAELSKAYKGKNRKKRTLSGAPVACSHNTAVPLDGEVLLGTNLMEDYFATYQSALAGGKYLDIFGLIQQDVTGGANLVCLPLIPGLETQLVELLTQATSYVSAPLVFVTDDSKLLELALRHYLGKGCVMATNPDMLEELTVPILKYGGILLGCGE